MRDNKEIEGTKCNQGITGSELEVQGMVIVHQIHEGATIYTIVVDNKEGKDKVEFSEPRYHITNFEQDEGMVICCLEGALKGHEKEEH